MVRVVLVDAPLPTSDTDLRSGYLERVPNLADLDLAGRQVDNLSIIESDVLGLLLPEGVGWVYIRRSTGLMRVRQAPDPLNHHEIASLFLRRAQDAVSGRKQRIARIAADIGQWVLADPHTSWVPGWAIYSAKYGGTATDEAVKYVCDGRPNLLAHWEWAKAQPRDEALIQDEAWGRVDGAALRAYLRANAPARPDDRVALAEWFAANYEAVETALSGMPSITLARGSRLECVIPSLEPFSLTWRVV